MDLFKLPISLRRSILSHRTFAIPVSRYLSTDVYSAGSDGNTSYAPQAISPALLTLTPSTLNSYNVSFPPNVPQLKYAASFFHATPPQFLYSSAYFRSFPPSSFPEVAFLGRSNVGKSSLLNALFGRTKVKDAHVSKRPGRTKTMNGFGIAGGLTLGAAPKTGEKEGAWRRFPHGGLVVVDMPGYGSGSREQWGKEITKYLENRKQLRRTMVLVDAEHGLKATDIDILTHLRRKGISHQIVLSKVDKLLYSNTKAPGPQRLHNKLLQLRELCASIRQRLDDETEDSKQTTGDILCCSAERSLDDRQPNRKLGVDEIRWAVLSACGMESDEFGQRKRLTLDGINVLDDDG